MESIAAIVAILLLFISFATDFTLKEKRKFSSMASGSTSGF